MESSTNSGVPTVIVDLNNWKRPYRTTSNEDRKRILQCARNGGDLKSIARVLDINIKTCRSIAKADREEASKRGHAKPKFDDDYIEKLCSIVDDNPELSLKQLKTRMEILVPDKTIAISSIDRLLDGHGYTRKKLSIQPVERNRSDVKIKRHEFAQWLSQDGISKFRLYIDETNYNVWCSHSYGRSKISKPCIRSLPSSRGANLNVIACTSVNGILEYECHPKLTWSHFNAFLEKCSMKLGDENPDVDAVFIFDNAPIHKRAAAASIMQNHSIRYLPPYSPFFNPIEEVFSKFKMIIKNNLSERRNEIINVPDGITIKAHRYHLLEVLCQVAFRNISPYNCSSYDRHSLSFIDTALNNTDM